MGDMDMDAFRTHTQRLALMKMRAVMSIARSLGLPEPFDSDEDRLFRAKVAALPPDTCGLPIIPAPARGATVAFTPVAVRATSEGADLQASGYLGRQAARAADAFDVMEQQARRAMGDSYAPLFTVAQVEAGRAYARVVERHEAGGMKLSSIEGRVSGGGGASGGRDIMDIRINESRLLDRWHAAIGDEVVFKTVVDRAGHVLKPGLRARELVHMVCCQGLTISQSIQKLKRSPKGTNRCSVRDALRRSLDKMGGA